jgi:Domain of unknown function (DUF4350)
VRCPIPLAAAISALLIAGAAQAQAPLLSLPLDRPAQPLDRPLDPEAEGWEGLAQFVRIAQKELGPKRVRVEQWVELGRLTGADALIIVHPESALAAEQLAAFMMAGGRVVLLDDYGTGRDVLAHFGIRRVPLPQRPTQMLRNNPALAIAEPVSAHAGIQNAAHLVTNHATGLSGTGILPLLAVHAESEPDGLLAGEVAVGRGRLLALGDASITMNSMLRFPGNRALASALVRYAGTGSPAVGLEGTVYVLANDVALNGTFGEGPTLTGAARHALAEIIGTLRRGMPPSAAYLAAVLLGLSVVLWTGTRAGRTHRPKMPRFVRPIPVAVQGGVAGRAASLYAPGASRVVALLELKNALEEQLAVRLGVERAAPHGELVAKARARGLLGEESARQLSELFARLGSLEAMALRGRRAPPWRLRDPEVKGIAQSVRDLVATMNAARHDRV